MFLWVGAPTLMFAIGVWQITGRPPAASPVNRWPLVRWLARLAVLIQPVVWYLFLAFCVTYNERYSPRWQLDWKADLPSNTTWIMMLLITQVCVWVPLVIHLAPYGSTMLRRRWLYWVAAGAGLVMGFMLIKITFDPRPLWRTLFSVHLRGMPLQNWITPIIGLRWLVVIWTLLWTTLAWSVRTRLIQIAQ